MKKDLTYLFAAGCCVAAAWAGCPQTLAAESLPYWKDMHVTSVNREAPRSAFMSYGTKEQAATGKYEASPYYQLLNGTGSSTTPIHTSNCRLTSPRPT